MVFETTHSLLPIYFSVGYGVPVIVVTVAAGLFPQVGRLFFTIYLCKCKSVSSKVFCVSCCCCCLDTRGEKKREREKKKKTNAIDVFRVREVVQTLYNFSLRPNWGLPIYVCDLDLNSKSKKCKLHFVFVLSSTVEMYDIKKMMSSMICVTQCGVYLREIINEFVRCSWMWGVWALLVFSALGFIDLLVSGFYRSSQLWALLIFSVLNFTDLLSSGLYWSQLWTLLIFQLWALLIFSASLNTKSLTHTKNKNKQKTQNPHKQTKNKPRIKQQQRKTKTNKKTLLTCLQLYVSVLYWLIYFLLASLAP